MCREGPLALAAEGRCRSVRWWTRHRGKVGHGSAVSGPLTDRPSSEIAVPIAAAPAGRYSAALVEARRGFDAQAEQLGKIRATAGGLLGYGGVAFSVLVVTPGTLIGPNEQTVLVVSVVLFGLLSLVAVWAMWPVKLIPGTNSTHVVGWADAGDDPDKVDRELALHYESAYEANSGKLASRNRALMSSLVLFTTTIILLVVRLLGV